MTARGLRQTLALGMQNNMRALAICTICLAIASLTGCAYTGARLTRGEAVQIATTLARHDGAHLEGFKPPRASFDRKEHQWSIFFHEKPPGTPGGGIFVQVDDRTGTATLVPSL